MNKEVTSPVLVGKPRITIITSVFNSKAYLEESIRSIIGQTYSNREYILVDGGSTDGSVDIIKQFEKHIDYWISERDAGIYDAWNKALKKATGDWLCFIGADDFFLSDDVLEQVAPHLDEMGKQGKTLVYGKVNLISEDTLHVIDHLGADWSHCRQKFRKRMTIAHCGAFHSRTLFERNGEFNSTFRIAADYEFLLREYLKDLNFAAFMDVPVLAMRSGGISGNLKNRLIAANETDRARKVNGLNDFSFSIFLWKMRIRIYILLKSLIGTRLSNYLADLYRMATGKRKRWSV